MNKRVEWIDLAKGLGMLLVILGHCVCFGGIMHNAIFAFHMPLFFILSGIVYKTNSKGIVSKKIKSLIVPYFIFSILGILVSLAIPIWRRKITVKSIICDIYLGNPDNINVSSIWFLMCMFWTCILTYLIYKIKKQYLRNSIVVILVILGFLFAHYRSNIDILPMKRMPLDIDVMLVAIGFLYLGINLKNVLLDKMQRKNIVLVGIGSVICFIPTLLINKTVNLHGLVFGNPLVYIIESISGSLIVICFCMLLQECNVSIVVSIDYIRIFINKEEDNKQMNSVKVLECTLRDGGYVNNWDFGKENIINITKNLEKSNADIIEMGFIRDEKYSENRAVYNSNKQLDEIIGTKKKNTIYAALVEMANYYPIEKFEDRGKGGIDAIRYSFWKRKIDEAYEYASKIVDKGYKLCVQPTRVEQYTEKEFAKMIEQFSKLKPYAIYIVDTFGLLKKEDVIKYAKVADEYLSKDIILGYHAHNNMQQAFSNVTSFIEMDMDRKIMVDASIYGMGRGAGNLNLEMIYNYLNSKGDNNYKLEPILETWDEVISKIYEEKKWGYTIPYFLAASMHLNPNYASYMMNKKDLSVNQINNIFENIKGDDKFLYNDTKAEQFYEEYK